jgi:hypothetical protein
MTEPFFCTNESSACLVMKPLLGRISNRDSGIKLELDNNKPTTALLVISFELPR